MADNAFKEIPEKYNNTIWDYQLMRPEAGAYVLGNPGTPSENEGMQIYLSFSPNEDTIPKPIIFPTKINAELYRQYLLDTNPNHPVKHFEIKCLERLPTDGGYYMSQRVAECPKCHKVTQNGDAETEEFYCPHCRLPFTPQAESE